MELLLLGTFHFTSRAIKFADFIFITIWSSFFIIKRSLNAYVGKVGYNLGPWTPDFKGTRGPDARKFILNIIPAQIIKLNQD